MSGADGWEHVVRSEIQEQKSTDAIRRNESALYHPVTVWLTVGSPHCVCEGCNRIWVLIKDGREATKACHSPSFFLRPNLLYNQPN